ncbi:MAG: DMT family transporter [Mollicutes bacterium]|nr:DMT family transporter [Mollicutes bacterium]
MWLLFVFIFIIFAIAFNQFFKVAIKSTKKDGALTVLMQSLAGICALILMPFFKFKLPTDYKIYLFLGLACIFYAISDRMNTTVRRGVEASTYSIIKQLSTVFMIIAGLLFFKEPFVWKKIIGAILIIFSNIFVFYEKGKQKLNKYVLLGILSCLVFSIALFLDVNISDNFNLAFYVALTLLVPALLLTIFGRIKFTDIKNELQHGNKKVIFITSFSWAITLIAGLRAYQLGKVTLVAPLRSLTVIGNVIVGYFFLNEKDNLLKKVIAAIMIVISVFLIKG